MDPGIASRWRAEVREGRSFNPDEFAIALEQKGFDHGADSR